MKNNFFTAALILISINVFGQTRILNETSTEITTINAKGEKQGFEVILKTGASKIKIDSTLMTMKDKKLTRILIVRREGLGSKVKDVASDVKYDRQLMLYEGEVIFIDPTIIYNTDILSRVKRTKLAKN